MLRRQFTETLNSKHVQKLIVDLRRNIGGTSLQNRPFIDAIRNAPQLQELGRLFVLIDNETFGAGAHFAFALEQKTQAIFIGSPTRHGPIYFADPLKVALPNSGLQFGVATSEWQTSSFQPSRRNLEPDLIVSESFREFKSGVDQAKSVAIKFDLGLRPGLASKIKRRQDSSTPVKYVGQKRRASDLQNRSPIESWY